MKKDGTKSPDSTNIPTPTIKLELLPEEAILYNKAKQLDCDYPTLPDILNAEAEIPYYLKQFRCTGCAKGIILCREVLPKLNERKVPFLKDIKDKIASLEESFSNSLDNILLASDLGYYQVGIHLQHAIAGKKLGNLIRLAGDTENAIILEKKALAITSEIARNHVDYPKCDILLAELLLDEQKVNPQPKKLSALKKNVEFYLSRAQKVLSTPKYLAHKANMKYVARIEQLKVLVAQTNSINPSF